MTREEIKNTNYGDYFETLIEIIQPTEPQIELLANWWSKTGVFEYCRLKQQRDFNLLRVMGDLKNLALEVLNG